MSMSVSVTSSHVLEECRSEGEGPTTASSQSSSFSNRVMVEQIFPQHSYASVCLLPESAGTLQTSVLRGQTCTSKIYSVDSSQGIYNATSEAELSAFLNEVDPNDNHIVELCCDPTTNKKGRSKSFFRFEFEDQIRKVQLLPLPLSTNLERQPRRTNIKGTETLGAILLVVAKRGGMSVHSLVLSRRSSHDPFKVAEFAKVSRGTVEDTGPCMEVSLYLDNTRDEEGKILNAPDPVLYLALLPCNPDVRSHRIDILACPLVCHKSLLFRFDTRGPTRALKRSLVLTGVGSAKGITISVRRLGGLPFCTLAALFDSEMKIISLPSLDKWSTQVLKPKDILTVPFDAYSTGTPSLVVPVTGSSTSTDESPVKFAVLCQPNEQLCVSRGHHSGLLSPLAYEASPSTAVPSKRQPPPLWTATETRNAVLRARRDIMTNVLHTLHGEDSLRKSLGPLQPFDESCLQTPTSKSRSSNDSAVLDENFDITIPSPDTAVLDMSGRWMSRSMSGSVMSPLAGLEFAGNDDSTIVSFQSNETPRYPSTRPNIKANPKKWARLVVLSLSDLRTNEDDSENSVSTHVHDLPFGFPSTFEAVSMKATGHALYLAAKSPASSEVRMLSISLAKDQLETDLATLEEMPPIQITKAEVEWKVNALEIDANLEGQVRLRVLTSKIARIDHRPLGRDALAEHVVKIEASTISSLVSHGEELSSSSSPRNDQHDVVEKLDMIMSTLLRFESDVNERLSLMEKQMIDNSKRLSRMEDNFSTRVEI